MDDTKVSLAMIERSAEKRRRLKVEEVQLPYHGEVEELPKMILVLWCVHNLGV